VLGFQERNLEIGEHRALRSFLSGEHSLLLSTGEREVVARSVAGWKGADLRGSKLSFG